MAGEFSRIVVRAPNWVGDAVMSLPFFASLRLNVPQSEIVALCRPHLAPLFARASGVNRVIALDESAGRHGWRALWRNGKRLRLQRFDLGFCLPPSFGAAAMLWLGGVPRRVGHASDHRRLLLTESLPYEPNGKRRHRSEGYLGLLGLVWPEPNLDRGLWFDPGPRAKADVDAIFASRQIGPTRPLLAIAPGAAQPNKLWAIERFAEVARHWIAEAGAVLIVGGKGDRTVCDQLANLVGERDVYNLTDSGDLPTVGEITRRCATFVGNDSGLAHLAAAVGTPTVVISGPGDPTEVAPFTSRAITVKKPLFCSPCYKNTCWRKDVPLECQELVEVADVWKALTKLREPRATT